MSIVRYQTQEHQLDLYSYFTHIIWLMVGVLDLVVQTTTCRFRCVTFVFCQHLLRNFGMIFFIIYSKYILPHSQLALNIFGQILYHSTICSKLLIIIPIFVVVLLQNTSWYCLYFFWIKLQLPLYHFKVQQTAFKLLCFSLGDFGLIQRSEWQF